MPRRILIILTCLSLLGFESVSAQADPPDVVIPSDTQDSAVLAEQFPISINDQPLEVRAWSGPDWLTRFDRRTIDGAAAAAAVEALLAAAEADLIDLSVATTAVEYRPGNLAAISAFRIPGTDLVDLRQQVIRVAAGPIEAHIAWGTPGGRIVLRARDAAIPGAYPITLYFIDDTAWVVQADQPTAQAIVAALPTLEPLPVVATSMPTGPLSRARAGHTATRLLDGRVLVVGGVDIGLKRGSEPAGRMPQPQATAEVWSPVTGTFSPAGRLVSVRAGHTATLLTDGRVLITGGSRSLSDEIAAAEVWDPETATFEQTGTPVEDRFDHAATLLADGQVLISGGFGRGGGPLDSAELWDPDIGEFTATMPMTLKRARHAAISMADGRVALLGTFGHNDRDDGMIVEVWDPATRTFEMAGSLTDWRGSPEAALLGDGRIFVVGGITPTLDGEAWDPATGEARPAVPGWTERTGHTATALPDGRVLVAGGTMDGRGYYGITAIPDLQVFEGSSVGLAAAGMLTEARMRHTATALSDGRVLIVGGVGNELEGDERWLYAPALTSAEIWDPG